MAALASINVNGLARNIEVKFELTGLRRFRLRMWMAAKVILFAGWIAGFTTEITVTTKSGQ